jgi:hypothetical protein
MEAFLFGAHWRDFSSAKVWKGLEEGKEVNPPAGGPHAGCQAYRWAVMN